MKKYESGWKCVKMDKSGWKGMKAVEMDESGWIWMKANENGWKWSDKKNANAWRSSPFQNIFSCSISLFFSFLFIQIFPNWSRCYIPIFDGLVLILLKLFYSQSHLWKSLFSTFVSLPTANFSDWFLSIMYIFNSKDSGASRN